jgi:Uma2 family endonuclease
MTIMATAPVATTASEFPQPRNGSRIGEPVWDVALWYPPQGYWTEDDYLSLVSGTNWMVEFDHGVVEFLPMPTPRHCRLSRYLTKQLDVAVAALGQGEVLLAPTPVRLWSDKYREPDIFFCRPGRIPDPDESPNGADLAIEIVSEGEQQRERDLVTKPEEYAKAKIDEYWIVDPEQRTITVLCRERTTYRLHGTFVPGQQATSVLLPTFTVDVAALFAAGEGQAPPKKKSRGRSRSQGKRRPDAQQR